MLTSRPLSILTYLTNRMGSISHHKLLIALGAGGRTHTSIPTFADRSNSKKQGAPGLKSLVQYGNSFRSIHEENIFIAFS